MRRFSQRNSLVTLNDINITPLLDLAFVLLIIFIITTPLMEKGLIKGGSLENAVVTAQFRRFRDRASGLRPRAHILLWLLRLLDRLCIARAGRAEQRGHATGC